MHDSPARYNRSRGLRPCGPFRRRRPTEQARAVNDYYYYEGMPAEWFGALKNVDKGRDYVLELADGLYQRHSEMLGV